MLRNAEVVIFKETVSLVSGMKNFLVIKFGKKRRFVLRFECETLFPVIGRFPVS